MDDQRNDRDDDQQVDKAACHVHGSPGYEPHNQQDEEQHQEEEIGYQAQLSNLPLIDYFSANSIRVSPYYCRDETAGCVLCAAERLFGGWL